jgi:hypothetical protein
MHRNLPQVSIFLEEALQAGGANRFTPGAKVPLFIPAVLGGYSMMVQ